MKKGTLIIVPGWMHTSREWARASIELPEWDVHVIDLPGFGVEPLVSTEWGVAEYAAFVREKLLSKKSLGRSAQPDYFFENFSLPHSPEKVIFLGHSFGGRVSAHMFSTAYDETRTQPLHADALILYAAPCIYRPSMKTRARRIAARAVKMLGLASLFPDSWKPYDLRQATDAGLGQIFRRAVGHDQTDELRNISVPTHILWGSGDTSVPVRIAEEMQTLLPASLDRGLTILPGEGHNIHLDNPTLLYGALRKMLESV